jgi:hypothetical protein
MPTANLQTDYWVESENPITDIKTDFWDFDLNPFNVNILQTDYWNFSSTPAGTLPAFSPSIVSAIGRVQQGMAFPQFIFGGLGGLLTNEYKLFKKGTTYTFALWRSEVYKIGEPFKVNKIRLLLAVPMTSGQVILPTLRFDNDTIQSIGNTINVTNYPNSDQVITLTEDNFSQRVIGANSFFLELQCTGNSLAAITFPITIEIEKIESEI